MKTFNALDWIAFTLVIVGGVNWGLVGFANFDLVAFLLGDMSGLARIVYGLVGLAAVYSFISFGKLCKLDSNNDSYSRV